MDLFEAMEHRHAVRSYEAVSYTHLDVYKRQAKASATPESNR